MAFKLKLPLCVLATMVVAQGPAPPPPPTLVFNYSNTLSDHAVLQRGVPAAVFGFGPVFAHFTISFTANATTAGTVRGIIGSDGTWRVQLPPQPAGGPWVLTGSLTPGYWTPVTASLSWELHDIYFGDVIICGGQSNMAYGLAGTYNATADMAAAANYPNIRFINSQFSFQNFSQAQMAQPGAWVVASPATVGGFSAVCYLTATRISDHFGGGLPLGLVDTAVGGTAAQLWLPPRHASACAPLMAQEDWFPPWTSSCWWNGMASPFTAHDIAFFLWDQGENNVGADPNAEYACLFAAVVSSWREAWRAPAAPFFFVQLPAYVQSNDTALAATREAQLAVADALPGVCYAVTADDGDLYYVCEGSPQQCYQGCVCPAPPPARARARYDLSPLPLPYPPLRSIHNRNKDFVANRLAATVLSQAYGAAVPYRSPRYASAAQAGDSTVRVALSPAVPLQLRAPQFASNSTWCPYDGASRLLEARTCGWFGVQFSDGVWRNATAAVAPEGDAVLLSTAGTAGLKAVATRYAYADWPVLSLYTTTGLPVMPWGPRNITQ